MSNAYTPINPNKVVSNTDLVLSASTSLVIVSGTLVIAGGNAALGAASVTTTNYVQANYYQGTSFYEVDGGDTYPYHLRCQNKHLILSSSAGSIITNSR